MRFAIAAAWMAALGLASCSGTARVPSSEASQSAEEDWLPTLSADTRSEPRIIGGMAATKAEWPAFANLRVRSATEIDYLCGGTFIATDWVLTAAHCFANDELGAHYVVRKDDRWVFQTKAKLEIVGGETELAKTTTANAHAIIDVIVHPKYKLDSVDYDIALVKLKRPWGGAVARLSAGGTADSDRSGARAFVAGHGLTGARFARFPVPGEKIYATAGSASLLHAMVPMKPLEHCQKYLKPVYFNPDRQICTGHVEARQDMCSGDSGGPLVGLDESGRSYQVGLVSYSFSANCVDPLPRSVYTRVSAFRDWILAEVPNAKFVDAKPEQAIVASNEMFKAITRVVPAAAGQIDLAVGRAPRIDQANSSETLTIAVKSAQRGRLIVFAIDSRGHIETIFPNKKTNAAERIVAPGQIRKAPSITFCCHVPDRKGGKVYALLVPEDVKFADSMFPDPETMRTLPPDKKSDFDPVAHAADVLREVAANSKAGGLKGWYLAEVTYPAK